MMGQTPVLIEWSTSQNYRKTNHFVNFLIQFKTNLALTHAQSHQALMIVCSCLGYFSILHSRKGRLILQEKPAFLDSNNNHEKRKSSTYGSVPQIDKFELQVIVQTKFTSVSSEQTTNSMLSVSWQDPGEVTLKLLPTNQYQQQRLHHMQFHMVNILLTKNACASLSQSQQLGIDAKNDNQIV